MFQPRFLYEAGRFLASVIVELINVLLVNAVLKKTVFSANSS